MQRFLLLAPILVLAFLIPLAGCGDDDGDDDAVVSVERYCELSAEGDAAGSEIFDELEADPDATREDFVEAERRLVEENEDLFDEIQEVAPDEIRDDVELLVAGIRERAGLGDEEVSNEDLQEAEARVTEFERENCDDDGAVSGDDTGETTTDETTSTETETETETETGETTTGEDEDDTNGETTTDDDSGTGGVGAG